MRAAMMSVTTGKAADTAPRVFVVDDDGAVRQSLQNLLRSVGLEVEVFGSAPEFLANKIPNGPSCLVLDVRLPDMSGLDFQAELARAQIMIPIIFITGHGDIPMTVRAMKGGAVIIAARAPGCFGHRRTGSRKPFGCARRSIF